MSKLWIALAGLAILPGCTATALPSSEPAPADGLVRAALGKTVYVDGPRVTPLAVIEDSRCPMNARCVWAGRVRLKVRVELGRGASIVELTSERPLPIADGTLELAEVRPDRIAGEAIEPRSYRFGFRFMGGL